MRQPSNQTPPMDSRHAYQELQQSFNENMVIASKKKAAKASDSFVG